MTGLRDLTNFQNFSKDASTISCCCKMLLFKEEAMETLSSTFDSTATDLEMVSGCAVSASETEEGQVIVLQGSMPSIHAALAFLGDRIGSMRDTEFTSMLRRKVVTLRVIVPNSVVGVLMGRSGKDIRNLAVSCGVRIQISQRVPGVLERIVHVTGTVQQAVMATGSIVETIQADPHTVEHAKTLEAPRSQMDEFSPEVNSAPTENGVVGLLDENTLAKHLQELLAQLAQHPLN
jgi:KH domain